MKIVNLSDTDSVANMHLAASSQKLHQAGYPTLIGSYLDWHPK